jgi:hypothetical protein
MHGSTISVPQKQADKPDPERLERRYQDFLRAS